MSWLEKVKNGMIITCGDGKKYTPQYLNATLQVEYNVSTYEFPGIEGTYVDRRKRKGAKYALEIFFQGENHLDVSKDFRRSADNPKAWTITHPLYDTIKVQPVGLNYDNAKFNTTRITGTIIETLGQLKTKSKVSAPDKIKADKVTTDTRLAGTYATEVKPTVTDVQKMKGNASSLYNSGKKGVNNTIDNEEYLNAFNQATAAVNSATSEPLIAITQLQSMINMPFQFSQTVQSRMNTLTEQLELLSKSVATIITRPLKKLYENNAGTLISAMCIATVTNITGSYVNRSQVVAVVEQLLNNYNRYIGNLNTLQSTTGADLDSYIPDYIAISALQQLVSFTLGNLFDIANNSKQQRELYLEEDSNIILVARRVYGLKDDDSTLNELLAQNPDIGINEVLQLKKGRRIVYYV